MRHTSSAYAWTQLAGERTLTRTLTLTLTLNLTLTLTRCADYEELRASMAPYLARPAPAPSGSAAGGSAAASVPARRAAKSPARRR